MKKFSLLLALAGLLFVLKSSAISLDDIQLWTGSGTNRAAMVVEWNSPILFNSSTVTAPVATKTLVWGYRFNGPATGTQMLNAIAAADPKLYVAEDETFGTFVVAMGYNLKGDGVLGITDGTTTNTFTNGVAINPTVDPDAASSLNPRDLFWSGYFGPNWNVWTEQGDSAGFTNSPNRGSSPYWDPNAFEQGQWDFAFNGLDDLPLADGSWIGFSVAAAGYPDDTNDPNYYVDLNVVTNDEQAPPTPDGTYTAYVCNTNDFGVQVISSSNIDTASPYNDPTAILDRPTLNFFDPFDGDVTDRVSVIDPPFNVTPNGANTTVVIEPGGQITVKLGRKIYTDPNHPYGVDFIVYGNALFTAHNTGGGGFVSDATDLNTATLGSKPGGHPTIVSVSQDGTNWYTYNTTQTLFPENAYRWDDTNASWTDEQMNPTKPLNPYFYTNNFSGQTVASELDGAIGAAGGTAYDLKESGFPWIQYVRVAAPPDVMPHTVLDSIAAVDSVVMGDALSISPDNLAAGITNLDFQSAADWSQSLISLGFSAISGVGKVNTVGLNDLSSYAPVEGNVSSACSIKLKPVSGTGTVAYMTQIGLGAGAGYAGNGGDLKVFQWNCTNWIAQPFTYNPAANQVIVAGVTNLSAFVVTQIIPPQLAIQTATNGITFSFKPVPNCPETLLRSTDLLSWQAVRTFTATNNQVMTLTDTNPPANRAFYRVSLNP